MLNDRVSSLRAELKRRGLSGFIVPHADEYQNEYLPLCAERLAWLTGFTGSAGVAVVLQDEAAIFVDGRYTLQVQSQVDRKVFVPQHLTEWPVHEWIGTVLKPGQAFGYDPWLHTSNEVEKFQQACDRAGASLIACETNPLDAVWTDRPSAPMTPAVPHELHFAGKDSKVKREELSRKLKREHLQAAVITAPDSLAWLLNMRGGDVGHTPLALCMGILRSDGSVELFIDRRKFTAALTSHLGPDVAIQQPDEFGPALDRLGQHRVAVLCDPAKSAYWVFDRLTKGGGIVVKGEDPCVLHKACKNGVEIQGAREAHKRDGAAVCRFLAWLAGQAPKGQVTELEAAACLENCRRNNDLWKDLSFPTISAAGSNGAIVHYRSQDETNRRLEPSTLYLVDSGAQYLDGTTDITRTLAIGTPTKEHRERYTQVLKGHINLATVCFPKGTTGSQLDGLARKPLWDHGLDYDHGTGHGVGSYLGVHEGPQRISKSPNSVALQPGMILSNEPGYYKSGEYGIRIENLVLVVPARKESKEEPGWYAFETLTMVPYDRELIVPSLLEQHEIEWIDAYHGRVRDTLTSLVDTETAAWLERATAPI